MTSLPPAIAELITALRRLPGIGPRSAERLALHLVQTDAAHVRALADALLRAIAEVKLCERCGGLTQQQPCALCADPRRDHSILCIVERPVDVLSIEKAGGYRGGYHVLGGRISPTNGVGPEDLRVTELEERLADRTVAEVVVALPTDVEGDATAFYLAKRLAPRGVTVTRLAHGLPAGSSLDFADDLTLSRAIEGRRPFA